MKILVLGASGMLGNACMNYFKNSSKFDVKGTIRSNSFIDLFPENIRGSIISDIDISNRNTQSMIFKQEAPDFVINCVGLVKQASDSNDYERSIRLNALLPHQLSERCDEFGAKLIHVSTDCVFSGLKGSPYEEADASDANDLYGRTKFLGEIHHKPNALTVRTSYIGNELQGANGLLEWFLSQKNECQGFVGAIYSGMPTIILLQAIENVLLKHPNLSGLYQVASGPISKYNLLTLIARTFKKQINIIPNESVTIDRTLDGSRFNGETGFVAPSWEEMIQMMYLDRITNVQR